MSDIDDLLKNLRAQGEWDEIDQLVFELEKLLAERNNPKPKSAFDDLDFDNLDKSCDEMIAELDRMHKQTIDDLFSFLKPKPKTRAERFDAYIDQLQEKLNKTSNKPN